MGFLKAYVAQDVGIFSQAIDLLVYLEMHGFHWTVTIWPANVRFLFVLFASFLQYYLETDIQCTFSLLWRCRVQKSLSYLPMAGKLKTKIPAKIFSN